MRKRLQIKGVKIKFKDLLDLDVVGIERPRDELLAMRKRLAKEANKRMTMLEKSKSVISGEPFTYGAYEHYAKRYLTGSKSTRFGRMKNAGDKEIVKEINVLQKFLKAPSSKVSEMIKFEKATQKMFQEKGFARTQSKAFYEFISSGAWQQMRKILPSEEIIEFISSKADNAREYKEMMQLMQDYLTQTNSETSVQDFKDFVNSRWNK